MSSRTGVSHPSENQCFHVDLNKVRNKQGNLGNFRNIWSLSLIFFCSVFICHFWLLCSQGLKEAVTALCLDNCLSLSSRLIFSFYKPLSPSAGKASSHLRVTIYKRLCIYLHSLNLYKYLSFCLCFNAACVYFTTHFNRSGNIFILLFLLTFLFLIQIPNCSCYCPKRWYVLWGWGWEAEIKRKKAKLFKGKTEKKKKERGGKKPSGNLRTSLFRLLTLRLSD